MRRTTTTLGLLLLISLFAAGCDFEFSIGGDGNVFELADGDCFDDPTDADTGQVTDVPVVDCTEPHDNEVFHTYTVSGDDYPGSSAIDSQANDECRAAFEPYVGLDYASSRLDFFTITPTQESWGQGDHEVVCALYDLELAKLDASMQGSGE